MEEKTSESKINLENIREIKSVKNNGMIIVSVILIIAGIAAMVYGFAQQGSSAMNIALLTAGIVLLILGVVLAATKSKKVIYETTGSPAKVRTYYFNRSDLEHMRTLLEHSGFSLAKPIAFCPGGNVKMDVIVSGDNRFAAAQIFEYVPFEYHAATRPHAYNDVQAGDFISFLGRCPRSN